MACLKFYPAMLFIIGVLWVWISPSLGFNPRVGHTQVEEKECEGTSRRFTFQSDSKLRYRLFRDHYEGCTHVLRNLEMVFMDDSSIDYDFSFLRHIRYVAGYVLIVGGRVREMPLTSLEIIRGRYTFRHRGNDLALMVALNSYQGTGLTTLMMPNLKEISNGGVFLSHNTYLGYINTIDWAPILNGRVNDLHLGHNPYNRSVSDSTDPTMCNGGGMWGPHPSLCQQLVPSPVCHPDCNTLCFGSAPHQCCHTTCALGCSGPTASDCTRCRDYLYDGRCIPSCPESTTPRLQGCIENTPYERD